MLKYLSIVILCLIVAHARTLKARYFINVDKCFLLISTIIKNSRVLLNERYEEEPKMHFMSNNVAQPPSISTIKMTMYCISHDERGWLHTYSATFVHAGEGMGCELR